jgi:hypothetical protein
MKKLSLVIVLLWAAHAHAGVFSHVLKPVGKAVAGASVTASKAMAGKSTKAAQATKQASKSVAQASKSAAQTSTKTVKKGVS